MADDSVDVVLSNCVINLTPDKSRVFREIQRVLKPAGRFSISDMVTYGDVPEAIRSDIALWTGCIAGALDRDAYLELIRSSGFREVRVEREEVYDLPWETDADVERSPYGVASVTVVGEK